MGLVNLLDTSVRKIFGVITDTQCHLSVNFELKLVYLYKEDKKTISINSDMNQIVNISTATSSYTLQFYYERSLTHF